MADPTQPEPQKIDPTRSGSKIFDTDPSLVLSLTLSPNSNIYAFQLFKILTLLLSSAFYLSLYLHFSGISLFLSSFYLSGLLTTIRTSGVNSKILGPVVRISLGTSFVLLSWGLTSAYPNYFLNPAIFL